MTRHKRQDAHTRHEGFRGVYEFPTRNLASYMASIKCGGKQKFLGFYPTAEEAALAYDQAAIEYYGVKAKTNFPKDVVVQENRIRLHPILRRDNTTGFRGVGFKPKRGQWRVRYRQAHLGWFDNPIDAAKAYNEAARHDLGDKAILNPVDGE